MEHNQIQSNSIPMEFYRSTTIGIALIRSLNTMLGNNEINIDQALVILEQYDNIFQDLLRDSLVLNKKLYEMKIEVKHFR